MRLRVGLLLGVLLGWGLPSAADILYNVTDLGTLNGAILIGNSLNNAGQVVGGAVTFRGSANRAFLYSNGQVIDLGTLGGSQSGAYGINNAGQITGNASTSSGAGHAFLYSNGQMQDLGTLGGSLSTGRGINNAGQVTGESATSTGATHAFLYSNGQTQDLGTLGGPNSYGEGINNAGQIAGSSDTSAGNRHAFLYSNGQMADLGTLGGLYTLSYGIAINNTGQVAGDSAIPTSTGDVLTTHAFLYSNGQMQDLGTLGGSNSFAYGLNNAGQVVGVSLTATGARDPFLYSNGQMVGLYNLIDLTQLNPTLRGLPLVPTSINDQGQIVAYQFYEFCNDSCFGGGSSYLLTPIPEPNTWALLGMALLGLAGWAQSFVRYWCSARLRALPLHWENPGREINRSSQKKRRGARGFDIHRRSHARD